MKIITPEKFPIECATAQNSVGIYLVDLSMKTPGVDGLTYARDAIVAYKAVLTVESGGVRIFTTEKFGVIWITAQRGVAIASAESNRRVAATTELTYLTDTIAAYKNLLSASVGGVKIITPETLLSDWALTQSALGSALYELRGKTQDPVKSRPTEVSPAYALLRQPYIKANPFTWVSMIATLWWNRLVLASDRPVRRFTQRVRAVRTIT